LTPDHDHRWGVAVPLNAFPLLFLLLQWLCADPRRGEDRRFLSDRLRRFERKFGVIWSLRNL